MGEPSVPQWEDGPERRREAAEQLAARRGGSDAQAIVDRLADGLNQLRDTMLQRVYQDVERVLGADSMLAPVSALEAERRTLWEIELFQTAEAADQIAQGGYAGSDRDWVRRWLAALRLGAAAAGEHAAGVLDQYAQQAAARRRLAFSNRLVAAMPEASRAPLVLLQLFPLAARLAAAAAFDDQSGVAAVRAEQIGLLPAIADCRSCRGQPLSLGQSCRECGNPLWRYAWLVQT